MANELGRRQEQPGQNDSTQGEGDERIRGVGDADTDEFVEAETDEEDVDEEDDEASV